jgi:hypothetical protein
VSVDAVCEGSHLPHPAVVAVHVAITAWCPSHLALLPLLLLLLLLLFWWFCRPGAGLLGLGAAALNLLEPRNSL